LPIERRFASVESMQTYVDLLLRLRWVRATWPERAGVAVTIRARRGQAIAHYERTTATIAIPPYAGNRAWAMRELVVLHELAHHLAAHGESPPHGAAFADRFVHLVGEVMGPEAGLLMRTAMHDSGVRLRVTAGVTF
jgi:putative metallohydrolase (TIGR04338 family)